MKEQSSLRFRRPAAHQRVRPNNLLLAAAESSSPQQLLPPGFREWLQSQGRTKATIKETINYSKKYAAVLDTGDASPLLTLSPRSKQHVVTALANLAKYQGRYDRFLQIRQRYSLKWSKGDSLQYLQ